MASKRDYRALIIPDLQIPFHAEDSLEFVKRVAKEIKPDEIYNVGDELDLYFFSLYRKHPEMRLDPLSELAQAKDELKRWYKAFPQMRLATSNHGSRIIKKALDADIPSQLLKSYRQIIDAPSGWRWRDEWYTVCKYPFRIYHGVWVQRSEGSCECCFRRPVLAPSLDIYMLSEVTLPI